MKSRIVVFATALLISASAFAQYKLEYKASGSAPLHYKAHTTLETTQSMMGQEAKVSVVSDQTISMTSTKSDGELVYNITIDSSENVAVLPSGDTNRTSSPALGKVKETRVHPNGEEISSKWLDTTFAHTQAGQMKDFGSFFFKLPTGEVKVGATWNQDKVDTVATAGGQGKILVNTNTNYKLVGSEKVDGVPCAKIEFTGKVSLKGSATIQGMELAIDGNGTISGSALFDYTNGRVVKINGSSNQDLVMASSGENAMTIPMSQKTNYELSLVK